MTGAHATRARVIAAARGWLGTPYHHQASLRGVGCDCLGLVRGVWRDLYGSEPEPTPPYSPYWAQQGSGETLAEAAERHLIPVKPQEARPGDMLLFRWRAHLPAAHCAVLTEPDRILHAHDGAAVGETAFTGWWRRHLSHAFAFPELDV
ncbi:putative phage cell wall peptidase, NlpC/P60 family [Bosea lupini]|uniref:Putative phage cell wall peptidase, NlpC/P60 family n=1 Tax=Bosea lupini TaxID=1036779 RepID=A0A1H7KF44_9HYPH|nr:NlpC/P60 family protein [Bosea lupini]SEK85392.1 putative phage cell wall peptidase, NlpC/P60 family [Bosea lupini]